MTKWKLVPVEPTPEMVWKAEEDSPPFYHGDPWYGSEPPSEGQVRAIYTAMLESAPQPPRLSDERIMEIYQDFLLEKTVRNRIQSVIFMARAIEREILGGEA